VFCPSPSYFAAFHCFSIAAVAVRLVMISMRCTTLTTTGTTTLTFMPYLSFFNLLLLNCSGSGASDDDFHAMYDTDDNGHDDGFGVTVGGGEGSDGELHTFKIVFVCVLIVIVD
jgi:hypothetical protein